MALQETVVGLTQTVWHMPCDVCNERSDNYSTTEEALRFIKNNGWVNKIFYKETLACESWYCPKCASKANEVRDTLPDSEELNVKSNP